MSNSYFIKNMEEKISRGDFTYFLTVEERKTLSSYLNKKKIQYFVYKPYPSAEKIIFCKKRKPSILIYEIKASIPLTHAAILGSLYANAIKKEMYGDIIIGPKTYIIITKEIENYLLTHIHEIKGHKIIWKKAKFSDIQTCKPTFETIEVKASSNRMDTVLANLFHQSRNMIQKQIKEKKVILNEKIVSKIIPLKENDIFSVRGYGKYIYEKEESRNKKLYITLKKYK